MARDPNLDRLIQTLSAPPEQVKPQGVGLGDLFKQAAGGAVQGTGYAVRGAAEPVQAPIAQGRVSSRDALMDMSRTMTAGDAIAAKGDTLAGSISPAAKKAIDDSQPSGDLMHPSTISLGKNPSVSGYALQAANVVGQAVPMLASALLTRGKALPTMAAAAASGGGAAGQQEQERIDQMQQPELDKLPGYQSLIAQGMSPADARARLGQSAGSKAALTTMPVSALSAFTEGLPVTEMGQQALGKIVGTSRLARATGGAALESLGEGAQEVAEQATQTYGADQATGENRSLTEDSFQNFALGAIGAAPLGIVGGLAHDGHEDGSATAPDQTGAPPPSPSTGSEPSPATGAPQKGAAPEESPVPVQQTPAFTARENPATQEMEVAPGVVLHADDGALSKAVLEGAKVGAMDTPDTTTLSDGSVVHTHTGELLSPPADSAETGNPVSGSSPSADLGHPKTFTPEAAAPESSTTASVPFMITAQQRRDLTARGIDRQTIARMKPAEAQAILAEPATKAPGHDDLDAIVSGYYDTYGVIDAKTTGIIARRFGVDRQAVADAKKRVSEALSNQRTATPAQDLNGAAQASLELGTPPTPATQENGNESNQKGSGQAAGSESSSTSQEGSASVRQAGAGESGAGSDASATDGGGRVDSGDAVGTDSKVGRGRGNAAEHGSAGRTGADAGTQEGAAGTGAAAAEVQSLGSQVSESADHAAQVQLTDGQAAQEPAANGNAAAPAGERPAAPAGAAAETEAGVSAVRAGKTGAVETRQGADAGPVSAPEPAGAAGRGEQSGIVDSAGNRPAGDHGHGAGALAETGRVAAGTDEAPTAQWSRLTTAERSAVLEHAGLADQLASKGFDAIEKPGQQRIAKAMTERAAGTAPVKWFGTQEKADAYVAKQGLTDSHEVVSEGRRFEVRPKAAKASASLTNEQLHDAAEYTAELAHKKGSATKAAELHVAKSDDGKYHFAVGYWTGISGNSHSFKKATGHWSPAFDTAAEARTGALDALEASLPKKASGLTEAGGIKRIKEFVAAERAKLTTPPTGAKATPAASSRAPATVHDHSSVKPGEMADRKAGAAPKETARDIRRLLKTRGEQIRSSLDAERRLNDGDRIFGFHEMDEGGTPLEIHNSTDLEDWAPDQLMAVSRFDADEVQAQKASKNKTTAIHDQLAQKKADLAQEERGTQRARDLKHDIAILERGEHLTAEPAATVKLAPKVTANTVFTEDAATEARALLKSKLGQLSSGLDPEIMQAGITLAGYHIEKGARTFAAYAKAMVEDLGDAVKPYLKSWYMGVKYDPRASGFEDMSTAAEVEAANVEKAGVADATKEATNERASTDRASAEALGEVSAGENPPAQGTENVGGSDAGRGAERAGRDSAADGEGLSGARSGGSGASEVHPAETRTRRRRASASAARVAGDGEAVQGQFAELSQAPAAIPARDFQITDETRLGKGGEVEKFNDNLAAIRVLKTIETENRRATPDEQATLARYVGWGGLANAFDTASKFKDGWEKRGAELISLLTPKELAAARRSTRNAHYTSQTVVNGMWKAMERLGFAGGVVLEPSLGTGNFIGLMPDSYRGKARFVGVELDSLTARIAGALYANETVLHSPFQKVPLAENTFDAVIGNPPFGQESLNFQFSPELNGQSIHNQFFLAGLDALKPGGVMNMVVSRYLLDKKDTTARQMMDDRAELLGAIRLPDSAFKENARTEVVTDILFFRKRTPAELVQRAANAEEARAAKVPVEPSSWTQTTTIPDPLGGDPIEVNRYFAENPRMMLGTLERSGSTRFGADVTLRGEGDFAANLDKAIARLPAKAISPSTDAVQASINRYKAMTDALKLALTGAEAGAITVQPGGALQQVLERETPSGDYELTTRTLSADSPWSANLYMDADGKWFRLVEQTDAAGNKVKQVDAQGKATRLNAYTREVFASDADVPAALKLGKAGFERLTALASLRDLLKDQLTLEAENAAAEQISDNRTKLDAAYDAFQKAHGYINDAKNAKLVSEMPDGALVLALEHGYRAPAKDTPSSAKKSAILSERVVVPYAPPTAASSAADALAISLAETGHVDLDRIAKLLNTDEAGVIAALHDNLDKPLAFLDPESKTWVARNDYLTGLVRRKLEAAKASGIRKNIEALEAVQPEPWGPENVTVSLGASWVPGHVYASFVEHLLGGKAAVHYSALTNSFAVAHRGADRAKASEWSTDDVSGEQLLSDILNSKSTTVRRSIGEGKTVVDEEATALAAIKRKAISTEFAEWAYADSDRRNQLVDLFNDKFNTRVSRQHDGSHLSLPGKVPDAVIAMRRHQKNAIWRGISERFMLVDHVVGAGKTFTAIARNMERRRMGLARKPMVAVPNHLVDQWASDIYRLYPGAKILAAGAKDFEKMRRRRLFAKIATGDWDMVVVPHSSFGFIGIAPETEERYLTAEIDRAIEAIAEAQEQANEDGFQGYGKPIGVKEAERLKEKLEARLSKLQSSHQDKLLTFEQLGVDDLTVDEAHEFKNLFYTSRLTGVRGMGDKQGSRKALDLYNKVRVLRETPTGAVTFLTGTPISNSAVEMYTMMRYLAADELADAGLENFDAWRSQFVDAEPAFEPTETGSLKEVTRLGRSWTNMRSLMETYGSFTDSVTAEDIEKWYAEDNEGARFPTPAVVGGGRQSIVVPPTEGQLSILGQVVEGFRTLKQISNPKERNAERLRLMDRARKVALDTRAAGGVPINNEAGGKLQVIADEVAKDYMKWSPDKGTQLIFLDRSVPKARGDEAIIKEYDALVAKSTQALRAGDDAAYMGYVEKLEKYDANEIEELRAAQTSGWNAYQQLKDNLVERGLPANEIRFVQEANNDAQKKALFDAVNAGEIRVLIGSTPRMGAGTNVQERLVGLHHADVTWKPSDIEQREGRIIRQGNQLLEKYGPTFAVTINAYATERTIDAKMWDLNSQKLKTINGIRKYSGEFSMDFEDEDAVGMAEMAALASGDPLLMERVKLASQIDKLELVERANKRRNYGIQNRLDNAKKLLANGPVQLATYRSTAALMSEAKAGVAERAQSRSVTVEGQAYTDLPDAIRAADEAIQLQKGGQKNAKFSIEVDGKRYTTMGDSNEAVQSALGDSLLFEATIDGTTVLRRVEAARSIAAMANTSKGEIDGKKVGELFGLPLVMDVAKGELGYSMALTVQNAEGRTLLSVESRENAEREFATQSVRSLVSELAESIIDNTAASRASYLERQMNEARDDVPELTAQLGKPVAGGAELAEKRQRLEEVIKELSAKDTEPQTQPVNYSKASTAPVKGVDPEKLSQWVRTKTAAWTNAPVIRVVASVAELPPRLTGTPGFDASVEGVHDAGVIYLIADRLASMDRAQQVLAHEAIGHYGVEAILGKAGFEQTRDQIIGLRDSGKLADLFEEIAQRYGELDNDTLAAETLAVMAEKGMRNTLMGRLFAAVRVFLRKLGFVREFSEGDLRQIITDAGRYLATGRARPLVAVQAGPSFSAQPQSHAFGDLDYGRQINPARPMQAPTTDGVVFGQVPYYINNASGESSASVEAINRLQEEAMHGRVRVLMDRDGSLRPLFGVDAVDRVAGPGQIIVQHGVGASEWTVASRDSALSRDVVAGRINAARNQLRAEAEELTGRVMAWRGNDPILPQAVFSKRPPQAVFDEIEGAAKWRPTDLVPFLRDKREDWRPGWLGLLTLRQLADVAGQYMPRIREYVDTVQAMQTRRTGLQEGAAGIADQWWDWQRKNREPAKVLTGVMHDATLAGVDPAKAFVHGSVTLSSGEVVPMTQKAVSAALEAITAQAKSAPPIQADILSADAERLREALAAEDGRVTAYAELKPRYAALPEGAKTIYTTVRDAYAERADAMQAALIDRIGGLEMSAEDRKSLSDRVRAHFESARIQAPYFPLARFGEYWVAAERNGEKEFRMMENRAQQRRVQQAYSAAGWTTKVGAKIDMASAVDGASGSFMAKVATTLTDNGVDKNVADEIYQLYLRTLPDLSVRKQFIHRKGVSGYDNDALRAFAAHMNHGAYQLARLENSHRMERTLRDMRKDVDRLTTSGTVEAVKAARAMTEVDKRHEWVMNPKDSALVQKLSAFNFIYYLGATPAAALVNLTQGAVTTFPALASRHGWAKALGELTKAMQQSIRTYGHVEKVLNGDELRAHEELLAMGAIDRTLSHDLAGMGEGSELAYNPLWRKTMRGVSHFFHKAEVFNREGAGLAAYRLARASGESHDAAVKYAADIIFETHFDYANANRARFMQGNAAKVFLAFKQYSEHMTYMLWRDFYKSYYQDAKGLLGGTRTFSPEERAQARRKLNGTLAMTAVFSGVMGLPLMSLMFGIANAFKAVFGDPDEPWDAETEFRNFLVEMLGPEFGKIAQSGPVQALTGLGIASRTQLDQMWFRPSDQELEGRAKYDYLLEQVAGPVGGIGANLFHAGQLYEDGHWWRAIETAMPKAVKDGMKLARYAHEGVNTLNGNPLVNDLSPYQMAMQAVGFSPAEVSDQYELTNSTKQYEKAIMSRRQALMDAYAMGVRLHDPDMIRATYEKINQFNATNPEVGITASTIRRSLQARAKYDERAVNGVVLNPKLEAKLRARVTFGQNEE